MSEDTQPRSVRKNAPTHSNWGVFGDEDEIGTLNFLTPAAVMAASKRCAWASDTR